MQIHIVCVNFYHEDAVNVVAASLSKDVAEDYAKKENERVGQSSKAGRQKFPDKYSVITLDLI
jgi:hypothetical protein